MAFRLAILLFASAIRFFYEEGDADSHVGLSDLLGMTWWRCFLFAPLRLHLRRSHLSPKGARLTVVDVAIVVTSAVRFFYEEGKTDSHVGLADLLGMTAARRCVIALSLPPGGRRLSAEGKKTEGAVEGCGCISAVFAFSQSLTRCRQGGI